MKQKTVEKIMKIWGWILLVTLVLGIPSYFLNYYMLDLNVEISLIVLLSISSVFDILLAIAFIRCKKDGFLLVAMGSQVIYRMISIVMNFSSVSVWAFVNLVIYISFFLFVVINCVEKFSGYRTKINKFWFVPSVAMFVVHLIDYIIDSYEKMSGVVQNVGSETIVQSISLGINASSSLVVVLQFFLLCYWVYKSYKNDDFIYSTVTENTEIREETEE